VLGVPDQIAQRPERDVIPTYHVLEGVVEHPRNPGLEEQLFPVIVAL
jgi:hypothetical protein